MTLLNRAIIVTGAASGIGEIAARHFADLGASVMMADINENAGQAICSEIRTSGGTAEFCKTNVADPSEVENMVEQTVAAFGHLYGAFNNAGVAQSIKPLHEVDLDQWQRVLQTNLSSIFYCMKYQIPHMIANGGGAIVNTSSSCGPLAIPFSAEYTATKHGVIGLTRSAAIDYGAQNIRVNTIAPGLIQTPMMSGHMPSDPALLQIFTNIGNRVPMQRTGQAIEIANAASWLLSDAASFVTGAVLPVDGGFVAG